MIANGGGCEHVCGFTEGCVGMCMSGTNGVRGRGVRVTYMSE